MREAADALDPGTSAGFMIFEHLWARGLRDAIAETGGVAFAEGFLTPTPSLGAGALARGRQQRAHDDPQVARERPLARVAGVEREHVVVVDGPVERGELRRAGQPGRAAGARGRAGAGGCRPG